jgi:hypothetical protein
METTHVFTKCLRKKIVMGLSGRSGVLFELSHVAIILRAQVFPVSGIDSSIRIF